MTATNEAMTTQHRTDARDLSCMGLQSVEAGGDSEPTFGDEPVDHYHEEMTRRGTRVYSCSIIGCTGDSPDHRDSDFTFGGR